MPKVPYAPIPDVAPQNSPAPQISVHAPPAAFGVGIAESIERLGGTAEKVGDELFNRAYAMQQLKNETESTEAIARYEKEAGMLHANYSSLQGLNAPNAFPQYQKDLDDKRLEIRNSLSNPMAQKMYDRSATSLMGRTIFNGAGHAAQQGKVAADGAAQARINSIQDLILQNPDDEASFTSGMKDIREQVYARGALYGKDDAAIQQDLAVAQSKAITNRIEGVNRTDPQKAKDMYEQYKPLLHSTDMQHVEPKIQQQNRIVGSRNISDAVNKGWAPYMSPAAIARAEPVQEPLQRIIQQAQRDHPELRFTVPDKGGTRTPEEQMELVRQGFSKTMHSGHLSGKAIDIAPIGANGQPDFNDRAAYTKIEAAIKEASAKLGIPLSSEHDRISSWDPGHYSLPADYDVGTAPKKVEEPEEARIKRATDFAKEYNSSDPLFADITRDRTQTDYRHVVQIRRDTDRDNVQTVTDGYIDRGDGQPARNLDEALANPKVRSAYDALPPELQAKVPRAINTYHNSLEQKTDQAQLTQLKGMSETDRDRFLTIDPMDPKLQLSQASRRQVMAWQAAKRKDTATSPRIQQAMHVLGPMLSGVIKKESDPESPNTQKYWEFWGAMDDALNYETQRTGKQPGFDEIKKIGERLLYTITPAGGHLWWAHDAEQVFNKGATASQAEKDQARAALLKDNPYADVSDRSITRMIALKYYKELSKGGSTGGTK